MFREETCAMRIESAIWPRHWARHMQGFSLPIPVMWLVFYFQYKDVLKVQEQKRKYKLKTMKYIHIVKLRAGHLMLSKMNDLAAQIRPSCYYSEPKMSVTNSPCLEGWINDSSMASNLSISFPNSLADWLWKAFFGKITNCTKLQDPQVKHVL